jgi:hypothetical protein
VFHEFLNDVRGEAVGADGREAAAEVADGGADAVYDIGHEFGYQLSVTGYRDSIFAAKVSVMAFVLGVFEKKM